MENLSIDTMVPVSSGSVPACWSWGREKIYNYVIQNRDRAINNISTMYQQAGHQVDMQQCIQLITVVLLGCLEHGYTYAAEPSRRVGARDFYERITFSVPYYNHLSIPISDVYAALGWFISMVEPPSSEVQQHRTRLICYSRLCLNIGKELMAISRRSRHNRSYNKELYPMKTHQLIVGQFGILGSDSEGSQETLNLMSSLSSSLPHDAQGRKDPNTQTLKSSAMEERGAVLTGLGERYSRAAAHMQPGAPRKPAGNPPGGCAEAINIASQHLADQHTCALGQAIDVKKLDCSFVNINYHLNEAGVNPCRNCIHFFTHGDVQQFDNGTGLITGPPPREWNLSEPWQTRRNITPRLCSRCQRPLGLDTPNAIDCHICNVFSWCSDNCFRADDIHPRGCPPPQAVTQQPPAFLPAIPGQPAQNIGAQYGYRDIAPTFFTSPAYPNNNPEYARRYWETHPQNQPR